MKERFFIRLLIILIVTGITGFSGCQHTKNIPEKRFIAETQEGLSLEYTEIWENNNFTGRLVINRICWEESVYNINKDCSWEKSSVAYPEGDYAISGMTVNSLKWEEGNGWVVNCYDSNNTEIKFGDDTLASIQFGWCTCSIENKTERIFVIDTKTYLGTEEGGIGGKSYIATLKEVK